MPTVPTDQNRVSSNNLPSVRSTVDYSPETFGAGVGRAIQSVGDNVANIARAEQEKQDRAVLMGAERELQDWQNKALFDPEKGAYAQRGRNAFGVTDTVLPEYDKTFASIESRLTDRQKEVFRQRAANVRPDLERGLMRHIGQESEKFRKAETTALVGTRLETAMLYATDPQRFETELREAQNVFMAGNDDLPPAALAVGVKEIESRARSQVVGKLMDGDPLAAQRYFDTYRDVFTAADAAQLERVLKPAVVEADGRRAVDAILAGESFTAGPSNYQEYRRKLESGGRSDAKNPESSAYGADQFTSGTWLDTVAKAKPAWSEGLSKAELLALRADPQKSGEMAAELDKENSAALTRAGAPITNENLYAAHHFGAGKGVAFAKASGDTPMSDILSADQLAANPYLRGKTKAEAIDNWNKRAGVANVPGTVASSPESAAAMLGPPSKADVLARINQIPDPAVRRAALADYKFRLDIEDVRKTEQTEAMVDTINAKVEAADPTTPLSKILSPVEYAWASEEGKVGAWEARLENRLKGTQGKTNPQLLIAYRDVISRAALGDPVAQAEVKKYSPYDPSLPLSLEDRDWLAKSKASILSGDAKKMASAATEGEINSVIKNYTVRNLGVPEKEIGTDTEEGQRAWQFAERLRIWANRYEETNGKAPSYTDLTKQADMLTLENLKFIVTKPGMLWDSDIEKTVSDLSIPPETQERIVSFLRGAGQPVTGRNVAQVYKNMQAQNK